MKDIQPALEHPPADRLAAFALGQLEEAESIELERHLALCETCLDAMGTLPSDAFIGQLRQAQQRGDSSDRKSTRLNSSHIQKSRMPSSA